MDKYDLVIIGGGAGAFAAAIKANELGAKTALVNKGLPLGGTCVNVGCVPSKTLLWAGEVMNQAQNHGIPGIEIEIKNFDFLKVVSHELSLVEKMREEKYKKVLDNLENVTHIEAKAKFAGPNEIEANGQKLQADKFIIAAGSTARVPDIEGINEVGFITHIEALKLEKQPRELLVIGAGPLGLEFSQMYSRFGTKVTILQRSESIFTPGERELTNKLSEILSKEGIKIHTGVEVKSASKNGERKAVVFAANGKEQTIEVDEILLASGKTANTSELGLESIGVEVDKRSSIVVNDFYQSKKANVYAVGDVAALPLRLETTAGREGTYAAENALKATQKKINYDEVPYTIFTDPQFASVGLTEEEQMRRMNTCACRTVSFEHVPKGQVIGRTEGLIKMSIHPEERQILGVHILSPFAGDLIAQAMVLVKNKNTIDDVVDSLPVFPTLSEALKIVALSFTKDIKNLSCCI